MSMFWIVGTVIYMLFSEIWLKRKPNKDISDQGISFLIPCFNEEETIEDTISNLLSLEFPNKQIIVINDGALTILLKLFTSCKNIRFHFC